jgi:hypothetical protein
MVTSTSASPTASAIGTWGLGSKFGTLRLKIVWPLYETTVTAGSMGQILFTVGSILFLFLARHLAGVIRSQLIS